MLTSGAMEYRVEFVEQSEVAALLRDIGLSSVPEGDDKIFLRLDSEVPGESVVRVHVVASDVDVAADEGASVVTVEHDQIAATVNTVVNRLHLDQALLIPIGKWRNVFDAVAFGLAENEEWQEVDAMASVELNSRDPLLCGPADFGTLQALIEAIYRDAEEEGQGFMITSTSSPVLVMIVPEGAARLTFGSQVIADEATETLNVS